MSEVIGKKAGSKDTWGGEMGKEFYDEMWRTLTEEKKTFRGEIKNKRKDGSEYFAYSSISPVLNSSGAVEFFVGIERDITKEKQIDKAKTEFVSLASHQLRTPLSTINWYTEMLLDEEVGKVTESQKDYLKDLYGASKRMTALVNALLNVSRLDLGTFMVEPTEVDLAELVEGVLSELEPQIKEREINMVKQIDGRIPKMMVDEQLMTIIFQNLLSNAVKYTPEKGEVSLIMDKRETEGDLLIKVSDTGYGIPKEQQDKIFSKLFRADNVQEKDTEGTGLGLYIIKSIVDQVGGKIWFESEEDKGTKFYVSLPLSGMKKRVGTKKLG